MARDNHRLWGTWNYPLIIIVPRATLTQSGSACPWYQLWLNNNENFPAFSPVHVSFRGTGVLGARWQTSLQSMAHHRIASVRAMRGHGWHPLTSQSSLRGNLHVRQVCGTPEHLLVLELKVQRGVRKGRKPCGDGINATAAGPRNKKLLARIPHT